MSSGKLSNNMKRTVIYHGDCPDGFTAAWACWHKWGDIDTKYVFAEYDETKLDWSLIDGAEVWMVDFCYSRDLVLEIEKRAASLRVLDHHITNFTSCGDLGCCTFDMSRSGAGLTWDTLHGSNTRPWLVDYIEDRDLWNWSLPHSRAMTYGIDLTEQTFANWSRLAFNTESAIAAQRDGEVVKKFVDSQFRRLRNRVRFVTLAGHRKVPAVNSSLLQSELGNELLFWYPAAPFSVVYSRMPSGYYRLSLRSENSRVDVSEVARELGGGGHRNSAGCVLEEEP